MFLTAVLTAPGERTNMRTQIAEIQENKQVAGSADDQKSPQKANVGARKLRVAASKAKSAKKAASAKKGHKAPKPAKLAKSSASARAGSKTAKVVDLLKRPGGATTKELLKVTGWQPHSVRGFLSGTVGKKMGLVVSSTKGEDGERTYSVKG